jgi:hypothetical protein
VGGQYNSRQGIQGFNVSLQGGVGPEMADGKVGYLENQLVGSSFSMSHGVPALSMQTRGVSSTTSLKLGFDASTFPVVGQFNAKFPLAYTLSSEESKMLGNGIYQKKAYGFLNMANANAEYDMTDFAPSFSNYSQALPAIAPSNVTHDIFSITGQGAGGVFKGYHADLGIYSPDRTTSITKLQKLDLEAGILLPPVPPFPYQVGVRFPVEFGSIRQSTGGWHFGDGLLNKIDFKAPTATDGVTFERTYFKDLSDRPALLGNSSRYKTWNGDTPVRLDFAVNGDKGFKFAGFTGNVDVSNDRYKNQDQPAPRNKAIQSLTKEEAQKYGLSANYQYYDNDALTSKYNNLQQKDHISEVSVLQADGMRYIYGLPAYNVEQEDASFSVQKDAGATNTPTQLVDVPSNISGYDEATGGASQKPEHLDKKNLPAYAHSWMLTGVVSADYVDLTGDGISEDDLGYWVDFKYEKTSSDYKWRSPYEKATYMPGTGVDHDDRASYTKGAKELFYLKEIRTKTHLAIFETEYRKDAIGASATKNGGKPSNITNEDKMKLLRRIKLYTLTEYANNPSNPEPLKTTHFSYMHDKDDYANNNQELCQGIPNHENTTGGKLTLHKVWFTYQKSNRGVSSPYVFHYEGANPNYSLKNNDCWGNYQANNLADYPYHQFPYTDQNVSNNYEVPWTLTRIDLPTGGSMNIEYEQDDYAYVEDKKAMQLYDIVHTGADNNYNAISQRGTIEANAHKGNLGNDAHTDANNNLLDPDFQYRVYFPLKESVNSNTSTFSTAKKRADWFQSNYIGTTKEIYFKVAVNLDKATDVGRSDERVDFVTGYAPIRTTANADHYGLAQSPNQPSGSTIYDVGYITLEASEIKTFVGAKDKIHPIRDAAIQYLKYNRQEILYGERSLNNAGAIAGLFNAVPDLLSAAAGYKYYAKIEGFCKEIFLDGFSQIRLLTPDGFKRGGGVRVKRISINDNWEEMTKTNGSSDYINSEYGQEYDYTVEENGKKISSGVAYEPFAGKEQNPLVTPIRYTESKLLQNDMDLFLENPIMMNHYPGASVGYRKVTMKSIIPEGAGNSRKTTPITEYHFYSPKEFPIKIDKSKEADLDKKGPRYTNIPIPFVVTITEKYEAATQGYVLIANDMAGKPRTIIQRTQDNATTGNQGTIISKQEYDYFTDDEGDLVNDVDVFTADGVYEKATLGVEVDVQIETNENTQYSSDLSADINLIGGLLPSPPLPPGIPLPIPASNFAINRSSLKTAVVQKLVNKKGILKSTTVTTLNSTIKTENLVFDALTCEPLLTRTTNEFNDDIYAYNQKAYWEYEGMAAAFQNVGTTIEKTITRTNSSVYPNTYPIEKSNFPFTEGDEVYVVDDNGTEVKGVVYSIQEGGNGDTYNYINIARLDGSLLGFGTIEKITITRSGHRNQLTAPLGAIASMKPNYQPNVNLGDEHTLVFDESSKILNATAMRYRDFWPNNTDCEVLDVCQKEYCYVPKGNSNTDETNFRSRMQNNFIQVLVDGVPLAPTDVEVLGDCADNQTEKVQLRVETCKGYRVEAAVNNNSYVVDPSDIDTIGQYTFECKEGDGYLTLPCEGWIKGRMLSSNELGDATTCMELENSFYIELEDGNGVITPIYRDNVDLKEIAPICNQTIRTELAVINPSTNGVQGFPQVYTTSSWPGKTANDYIQYRVSWPAEGISTGWSSNTFPLGSVSGVSPSQELADRKEMLYNFVADLNMVLSNTPLQYHLFDNYEYLASGNFPFCGQSSLHAFLDAGYHATNLSNMATGLKIEVRENNDPNMNNWGSFTSELSTPYSSQQLRIEGLNAGETYTLRYMRKYNGPTVIPANMPPVVVKEFTGVAIGVEKQVNIIEVTVPANQNATVGVYDDPNTGGNLTNFNTAPGGIPPAGVSLRFPIVGEGVHNVKITEQGQPDDDCVIECGGTSTLVAMPKVASCGTDGLTLTDTEANYGFYNTSTKGNWRPWTSYTYVAERDYTQLSIRDKGIFKTFTPFDWSGVNTELWQSKGYATKYDRFGYELESIDAIGNYSAALYGYDNNLPIVVAQNARYNEIMFDGFENYPHDDCETHWVANGVGTVSSAEHHTGKHSYAIPSSTTETFENIPTRSASELLCARDLSVNEGYSETAVLKFLTQGIELPYDENDQINTDIPKILRTVTVGSDPRATTPLPKSCNCLGKFTPSEGKKYTLSTWLKVDLPVHNVVSYNDVVFKINFRDGAGNIMTNEEIMIRPEGSLIEKWQRLSGDFFIPTGSTAMVISVENASGSSLYLDDMRMHPFDASIATYVYDKISWRSTAVLDDNNYATFYIYDERGQLEKTKKETTEGIKTINEGRQYVRGPIE